MRVHSDVQCTQSLALEKGALTVWDTMCIVGGL